MTSRHIQRTNNPQTPPCPTQGTQVFIYQGL